MPFPGLDGQERHRPLRVELCPVYCPERTGQTSAIQLHFRANKPLVFCVPNGLSFPAALVVSWNVAPPNQKIFLIRALLEIPAFTGPKGVLKYPLEGGGVASASKPFPHLSTASLTPAPPRVRDFNPARI